MAAARSMGGGGGAQGAVGSNVTCFPPLSTAVHRVVDGHATPVGLVASTMTGNPTASGAVGLKVTSAPLPSTVVHCVVDEQAVAFRGAKSIVTLFGEPGA